MNKNSKIYIAGHTGMVGSSILRKLKAAGFNNLVVKSRKHLNLIDGNQVLEFFKDQKPDYVFVAAAKVGGIKANSEFGAQFLYENLMIQNNIIHSSHQLNVEKLLFLGSACIYPRDCKQPMLEEYLLNGNLEPTNEGYAIAKIAGIKLCENYYRQYNDNFISIMPNNLYGPNDNYDLNNSHVLPALIRKIHEAYVKNKKEVIVWGSGSPLREFLHVDDLASACITIMQKVDAMNLYERGISHLNVGSGSEISIKNLAFLVKKIIGYSGKIVFDKSKPYGMPRKFLDSKRVLDIGWYPKIDLEDGIKGVYKVYTSNEKEI